MGIGGISWPQLLIILVIVLALFGTKRLRNIGGDVAGAIKGFKTAMKDGDEKLDDKADEDGSESDSLDAEKKVDSSSEVK